MLLGIKTMKLYPVFHRISSVRLGLPFFFIIILSVPSRGIDSSDKPGDLQLNCTVNKDKFLICYWSEQSDTNENYTLYYWFSGKESSAAPCPQYLITNRQTVGCQILLSDTFTSCTVKLNSTRQGLETKRKFDLLQDWVKTDPPSNLYVVNTSSLELLLTWEQSVGSFPAGCMAYQVQHRNMASEQWTFKDASSLSFTLPSYDPRQTYTFHVRSQIDKNCGNSKFWSDWSQAVTWGRNVTVTDEQQSTFVKACVILVVTFLLLVVAVLVIRADRIWVILVPQIPNPGKKFEDLFKTYDNNFQDWIGISKKDVENLQTNYTETLCTVTEDPDCTWPDGKNPPTSSPTK
ncbi:cytokine receptor common subunit gamma [Anomaloglossus baeobatrachus]|uniref:cytokine receptor common subunit gamma n=1 Tax=Anomaloglossus baeobatrachus TaxID=238106 RepID=UPI003F4FDE67